MTEPTICQHYFCMSGHIRTQQRCPKCMEKFPKSLVCSTCLTQPTRFYLDVWWQGERLRIFSTPQGFPLDSKAQADQILATIRHQIGQGKFDSREWVARELKGLQFGNYAALWLDRLEKSRVSRGYLREAQNITRRFLIPFFSTRNIRDLRDGSLQDFLISIPMQLSSKTVSNILKILHALLAGARDRKDILVMPKFPKLQVKEAETKWLTVEDQEKILAHLREPYRTFFLFCMKHGTRLAEARALTWEQIDLKRSVVTVNASMDLNRRVAYTKEKRVRVLPLNTSVRQMLLALPRSLSGYVFTNRSGRPLSSASVRAVWGKAAQRAGIQIGAYQGTRHSFATQALLRGYSERFVMEATGHKSITAFRRYGKLVTEALRDMIEDTVVTPSAKQKPT